MLTTPQAPCTPNWMQNAPAESALKLSGRIQSGMNAAMMQTKMLENEAWWHEDMRDFRDGTDAHDGQTTANVLAHKAGDGASAA